MKKLLKLFAWIAGVLLLLLTALQVILSEKVATSLVNKYAPSLVTGADVNFGKASVSLFRHFPFVGLNVGDVVLSIPSGGVDSTVIFHPGLSDETDTLAFVKNLDVSFNLAALVAGHLEFPDINLSGTKLFYRKFADSTTNWTPFLAGFAKDTSSTSSSSSSMPVILEKVNLDDRPFLFYSNPSDTVMIAAGFHRIAFNGRFNTAKMLKVRGRFNCDSLFLSGIHRLDSVFFALNKLELKGDANDLKTGVSATLFANTARYGRMAVPVTLNAKCSFPEDSLFCVEVPELLSDIAGIPLKGEGKFRSLTDSSSYVRLIASIDNCRLEPLIADYVSHFWKDASLVSTDAELNMNLSCDGVLDYPVIPDFHLSLGIPKTKLNYSSFSPFDLMLDFKASSDSLGHLGAVVDTLYVNGNGISFGAGLRAEDLLGPDPSYTLNSSLSAILEKTLELLPEELGINGSGTLEGKLGGHVHQSQLNLANIAKADLGGFLSGNHIEASYKDVFSANADNINLALGAMGNRFDDDMRPNARLLALLLKTDSLKVDAGSMTFAGKNVSVKAHNSAEIITGKRQFYPFSGTVKADAVIFRDGDSLDVAVRNTEDSFSIKTSSGVPVLSLDGNLGRVLVRSDLTRIGVRDVKLNASARMNTFTKNARRKAFVDSLMKAHPGVPKDSLFRVAMMSRRQQKAIEEDLELKKKDLNIRLAESLAKYYRDWDINGSIDLKGAALATPRYPLRTSAGHIKGSFTNDEIVLDSISVRTGVSNARASGSLTHIRRALVGRGPFVVDMNLSSGRLDLDEVVSAINLGKKIADSSARSDLSDAQYEAFVTLDSIKTDTADIKAFIVPRDLQAHINVHADSIQYFGIAVKNFRSDLVMQDRCIQMTNSAAITEMGKAFLEGFYSTQRKNDMKLGFFLNLLDVTAEKVIEIIPAVDSLVPMLTSFSGMLDCQFAATARLDTDMNILVPSINGIAKISGEHLTISNNPSYTALAKKLMFKNKNEGNVDRILIEGLIGDSKIEVFPFVLSLDRYQLAMSGIQNLDSSFKYHVSVLRSPLPFKLGLNLDGSFDNVKVSLVKPKYKSASVPAFTTVLHESTVSLMESIHNIFTIGADKAIDKNEAQEGIAELKQELDYVQAVDLPSESISKTQEKKLKMITERPDTLDLKDVGLDTLTAEQFDSLSVERLDSLLHNKSEKIEESIISSTTKKTH